MTGATVIEAMLLRWGESPTGRTVTFLLPEDEGQHPFKGLKTGPSNGQRLALSIALIADDESETPHNPPAEAPESHTGERKPEGAAKYRLSVQAHWCCEDTLFWAFLRERGHKVTDADSAAEAVRHICLVLSRSQFDVHPVAAERWRELHGQFVVWRVVPELA